MPATDPQPRQLIMFDIDGTLVDSQGFDGDLFAHAVRKLPGAVVAIAMGCWRETAELKLETAGIGYRFNAIGGRVDHSTRCHDFLDAAAVLDALGLRDVADRPI